MIRGYQGPNRRTLIVHSLATANRSPKKTLSRLRTTTSCSLSSIDLRRQSPGPVRIHGVHWVFDPSKLGIWNDLNDPIWWSLMINRLVWGTSATQVLSWFAFGFHGFPSTTSGKHHGSEIYGKDFKGFVEWSGQCKFNVWTLYIYEYLIYFNIIYLQVRIIQIQSIRNTLATIPLIEAALSFSSFPAKVPGF